MRPRKDHRGVDLISDVLPFGWLWHAEPNAVSNAIGYAKFYSRSHQAVIRVYDEAGNVIETHERKDDFKEWWSVTRPAPFAVPLALGRSRGWVIVVLWPLYIANSMTG
jgi:hypothetical protein